MVVFVLSKKKKTYLNHAVKTNLSLFGNFPTNPTSEARFTQISHFNTHSLYIKGYFTCITFSDVTELPIIEDNTPKTRFTN